MSEDKLTNKNRVILTGILTKIEPGTTLQGFPFLNIIVESTGLKYTDKIPCVVYGNTATRMNESVKVGDSILVSGRVREKTVNNKSFISIVVSSVKKSI